MEKVSRGMKNKKINIWVVAGLSVLAVIGYYATYKEETTKSPQIQNKIELSTLKNHVNYHLKESNLYESNSIDIDGEKYSLEFSINDELDKFVKKRLRYYRPDMAAIVVLENKTGKILTAVGYDRKEKTFNDYLPFSGTHPSASIFKIVTTAELFEDGEVSPDSEFKFRGKGTTLYKYQLKEKKDARWVRHMSFQKAFAYSNNVVFGKAAIENTTPFELKEMAERLGFNQELMEELSISKSTFIMPESGYNLAEIASGFNKDTQMSPVHCALLSSVVANDGALTYPRLVTKVIDNKSHIAWENEKHTKQVIKKEVSDELKELMRATINKGTARRKFRNLKSRIKKNLDIGGKTGSITGGFPFGKRDWFTSFAVPLESPNDGISVCVMNINFKKWYVKSARLAQEIIQYYYSDIKKLE